MSLIKTIIVTFLAVLAATFACAEDMKTASVDRLLQREYVGSVLIDDERGVAYFERIDAIDSSPVRFPYPTGRMYKSALKKIYVASLNRNTEAEPLFKQDDSTGYYFASDKPWSPSGRFIAIYRFHNAQAQPGIVDLQKRTAKFFDVSALYSLETSLEWVSSHEFVIATAEGVANTQTYRVNGVLAIDEVRNKGWRDGAVTADVVGAGKYAAQGASKSGVELVKIDTRSGSIKPIRQGVYRGDDKDSDQLHARLANALDLDGVTSVAVSETGVFYLGGGDLWRADLDGESENLTSEYLYELKLHETSDIWRDVPLAIVRSGDNERTRLLDNTVFSAEIEEQTEYLIFSANGQSYNAISPPYENAQLLAASGEGAVFLTNSYEHGSLLQYIKAGEEGRPTTLYHFNQQLAGVSPAVGPIPVRHHGFDGRAVTSWLYLPPGASLERPSPYPTVMIPYSELVYSDDGPIVTFAMDIWRLNLAMNTAMEVFAAQGYAVLLPSIPLVDRGQAGEPMMHIMSAVLSSLNAAIETGYVDSHRVAVSGHSGGGYAALAIATQTKQFKAVVAQAPVTNLVSLYGQFVPYREVEAQKFTALTLSQMVKGWGRMAVSPWRDADRYVRNSPLFFAHQAETPIMLIHGDYDGAVVVEQSEEMFTALRQEDKDVTFVRYFGEHHIIARPENQRDMWRRIFNFLSEM